MSGIGSGKWYIDYPIFVIIGLCVVVSWPFRATARSIKAFKKWAKEKTCS